MSAMDVQQSETKAFGSAAEDGFAVAPGVFELAEMNILSVDLSASSLPRTRAGVRHILRYPAVHTLAHDPRLLDIAREILGPQALPFHATLFDKSPNANWLVVWHQDTALPLREKLDTHGWEPWSVKDGVTYAHAPASALEQILAIRVHLDNSTSNNGPLRILPGTHNRGVLTDDEIHRLSTSIAPVECTVTTGGLILMRPLIVHASSKSTSPESRRVLHIEYSAQTSFGALELALA